VRVGSVAAGAGRQCAPAAPIGCFWAALNFTVRCRKSHGFLPQDKLSMSTYAFRLRSAVLAAILGLLAGCASMSANPPPSPTTSSFTINPLKLGSAGHTGCLPDDNAISNVALNPNGSGTWNATCKGKVYLCSAVALRGDSQSIGCAPVAQ
jgi:hypothetical protein